MDMKGFKLMGVIGLAFGMLGCGGDFCSRLSPCPSDPKPTESEIKTCRQQLDSRKGHPCGNEFIVYLNCTADNLVCGSDGKVDAAGSASKTQERCNDAFADALACCIANQDSPACTGM
jgi:hypothetical protein